MTASTIPSGGDENDRVWSSNRWTVTRSGPWHLTIALRGGGKARSYTNTEAAELARALTEAAERAS